MAIELRPYQIACKEAIKSKYDKGIREQLIVEATGLGKRLQAVDLMRHFKRSLFLAHREELILQAYNEINDIWPMQAGIIKGTTFELDKKIVVGSVQTMYNRLDRIDPNTFDLVIVDECFPAGTKVDGMNIEDYQKGFLINSFNHTTNKVQQSIVTRVMKRKHSGKLYDFGQFQCTPNHPIFIIGIGYCLAKEIHCAYLCNRLMYYGTKIQSYLHKLRFSFRSKQSKEYLLATLRVYKAFSKDESRCNQLSELWEDNSSGRPGSKNIHALSPKRIWSLFRKMQKGILFENRIYNYEQYQQNSLFRKDEEKQSNVQTRTFSENEKVNVWTNILKSRRKRSINKTTNYIIGIDPIGNGISNSSKESNVSGEESSNLLQSGFSMSRSKISYRNRWKDSSIKALEILRQTKDGCIEKSWLENIKIHKPTSRRESGENRKENYVYNLEVKGNNNYFANSVLVHNCHHFVSPTFLKTLRHFTPKLRTCWTATPKRLDGLSLTNIAQEIIFEYRIENGIKDGWLAEIEAYQIKTQADLSGVKRTAGDFNQKELSERVDSRTRNALIATKYKQYATGRQGVAYCVDMQHAYNLRDILREHGISSETIVSDPIRCPNRKELIDRFKKGEFDILTNCEILTEGFDYHDVGCVIMARPTQSETLYVQCIGRGTRLKSQSFRDRLNANNCIILDFVDNTGKLSIMNAYELEKHMAIEDRMFLPKEYKEKLLNELKERRERMIKQIAGFDKKINLLTLPEVKVWNSEKMLEPATDKQIKWLKDINVWQEDVEYTKSMASELISSRPAEEWQIRWLAERKYDVSQGCSLGQYQRVKFNYEQKNKYAIDASDKAKILKQLNGEQQ